MSVDTGRRGIRVTVVRETKEDLRPGNSPREVTDVSDRRTVVSVNPAKGPVVVIGDHEGSPLRFSFKGVVNSEYL